MNDNQLSRYSRHMALAQFGLEGQRKVLEARVLVIGAGGLGSPTVLYLAASGVGQLVIVDFDIVELSNLQRQILHDTGSIGQNKVESARESVTRLNSGVKVTSIARVFDAEDPTFIQEVQKADVVVDGTDNFETRFELNKVCVATDTPLVSGAALRHEGQVTVFDTRDPKSPCYRCLYSDQPSSTQSCADVGVFSPLLGIIGSIEAGETLKLITGMGETLVGRVLTLDTWNMEIRSLRLNRDPACPICATRRN